MSYSFGDLYVAGLPLVLNLNVIMWLLIGTLAGVFIGALPGLTGTMAVAVITPLTYSMGTINSFALLLGAYCGAIYGGSITAILAKIPGTPSAIMTAMDGYPMGQRGEGGRGIGIATTASFIGGLLSVFVLSVCAPAIASMALKFSAQEYFAIGLFGLAVIAYVSTGAMLKGIISGALGVLVSTIGPDIITGYPRFTFENINLQSGIDTVPVLIGLFGLCEVFIAAEKLLTKVQVQQNIGRIIPTRADMRTIAPTILRCTPIGIFIGAVPAAGGTISSIVAYGMEKKLSKHPERFGTGIIEGIAAPETANNASSGGAMIPMLTLGIPGDAVTAILISALIMKGLLPGPTLFSEHMDIVSSIFLLMAFANLAFLFIGLFGARYIARVINFPMRCLLPVILLLCMVGTYAVRNNPFDIWILIFFGVIGFSFEKLSIPTAPLVLGLVLGNIVEAGFRRSLVLSQGDFLTFVTRPISGSFILLTLLLLLIPVFSNYFSKKRDRNKRSTAV